MKNIGILTSGGDAPGMNAAIRAVVRTAIYNGRNIYGVYEGYHGLIDDNMFEMHASDVSNIIQRGGTILRSARSKRFFEKEYRQIAHENLLRRNIDSLVLIGGDGTFKGACEFKNEFPDIQVIGIPGTIDNDLYGTDYTIGFDTACNTVVEAVDKIRDTASSHSRIFFVEVMGRDAGYIALYTGIANGAEEILIPETKTNINDLVDNIQNRWRSNKKSSIIIVAEGEELGGAVKVSEMVKEKLPDYEIRYTVLGHIQRGGNPTLRDRLNASRMGYNAVKSIMTGDDKIMIGIMNEHIVKIPLERAVKNFKGVDKDLIEMMYILAI
ncbi:MAG: 6-phosphofructokinase isozyme 1 [Bacteroidetes bacterium ADurb.Bin035]|jgi:6-phosphofructokinase 1|nr:MAG: 6-phosphofructokinase isozyme 1 [Bacteroidetes bacterium ADurb.Bin035]HNQ20496.1 6-phosphofructokinase [Bacteroidales bacterium]HRT72658.1 6-phosphofructokinase [Bacteroidales bacterium]